MDSITNMHIYGAIVIGVLFIGVDCQELHQVVAKQIPPVRTETTARLRCSFIGDNITVQYVSWTKYTPNERRSFVYEYSQHPPLARAYNDFIGRAKIAYADMNDNRYSYLRKRGQRRRIVKDVPSFPTTIITTTTTEPPPTFNDPQQQQSIGIEEASLQTNDEEQLWSNMHESIYGVFTESLRSGRKPDFSRIDRIFRGMDDRHNVAHKLKNLEVPVTREDIKKIMLPISKNDPITLPARLTPSEDAQLGIIDDNIVDDYWNIMSRNIGTRKKRSLTAHHIDLELRHVLLKDEARYECLVKPLSGPAMSSSMNLVVQVVPRQPIIEVHRESYADGSNITITCKANVGKPAGTVTWARRRTADSSFLELPERDSYSYTHKEANGTTAMTSKLEVHLTAADDGALYRCTSTNPILDTHETRPSASKRLRVLYAPRGGRILFDTAVGRYYCHARGKPSPTYSWIWLRTDNRQTLMSKNRYLDLSGMRRSGYYRFHCLASNTIDGIKHTKVMATKLRVIAPASSSGFSSFNDQDLETKPTTTTTTTTTTRRPTTTTTTTTTPAPTTPPTTTTTTTTRSPELLYKEIDAFESLQNIQRKFPGNRQLIPTLDLSRAGGAKLNVGDRIHGNNNNKGTPGGSAGGEPGNGDDYYYYYYYDTENKMLQPAEHFVKQTPSKKKREDTKPSQMVSTRPIVEKPTTGTRDVNRLTDGKSLNMDIFEDRSGGIYSGEDLPQFGVEERETEGLPYDAMGKDASAVPFDQRSVFELSLPEGAKVSDRLSTGHQADVQDQDYYKRPEQTVHTARPIVEETKVESRMMPTEGSDMRITHSVEYQSTENVKGLEESKFGTEDSSSKEDERRGRRRKYSSRSNSRYRDDGRNKRRRVVVPERKRKQRPQKTSYAKRKSQKPGNAFEKIRLLGPGDFDCSSRRSGIHRAGCRAFYRCVGDQGYFVECRQPYVYNKITEQCGDPKEAPAPCGKFRDCSRQPNRKFVDSERGCQYYYTCYMGFFMGHNECNPGLVFNEKEQLCDWPQNLKGKCGQNENKKQYSSKPKGRFAG